MADNANIKDADLFDELSNFPKSVSETNGLPAEKATSLASVCTWEWHLDTGTALYSAQWDDLLSLKAQDERKEGLDFLLSRVNEDDLAILQENLARLLTGGSEELDVPVRMKRFDNTWAWVLLRGKVDSANSARRIFGGVGLIVSGLRLDHRFLPPHIDDNQNTYQNMLDNSPIYISRFDREMFPLYLNPAMCNFGPYSSGQVGELTAEEVGANPDDMRYLQERIDEVFISGKGVKFRWTMCSPYKDMPKITGDFTLWPEFDANGKVKTVISQFYDLTQQIAQEEEAHINEMRFASLHQLTHMDDLPEDEVMLFVVEKIAELTKSAFSHLHILPSALQKSERIIWSSSHNNVFTQAELTYFDASLMRGEFGQDAFNESEPIKTWIQNYPVDPSTQHFFRDRLPVSRFACAQAMEGDQVALIAAVYNKESPYTETDALQLELFIKGAWHIIRRRHYVSALKDAIEEAQVASMVKNRFLASVSHELRTPLNGMLSMLQLLEFSNLTAEQAEYAKRANSTGKTLMRIISDIIDYSRMESGSFELDIAPFDIADSLRGTLKIFYADAKKKNLDLKLTLEGQFPAMILGDEARLRQIVFNLVGNALKFTEFGEIEVICKASPKGPDKTAIEFTVRDTGIGIPEDMQQKVFDAFTQVGTLATRKHQGSGLGLGIVRQLLQRMGGTVSLQSKPRKGTTITCFLTFPNATPQDIGARKPLAAGAGPEKKIAACPPMAILVAEDDQVSRMAMKLFLQKLGHKTACVSNGREALEALRLYRFDCLITDVLMPEMDGVDITMHIRNGDYERIKTSAGAIMAVKEAGLHMPGDILIDDKALLSIDPGLPIVAVSAHAMKGDKERFLEQGMDYYVSKPVQIDELRETLARLHTEKILPKVRTR